MRRFLFVASLLVMALIAASVAKMADTELPEAADLQQSSFICDAEVPDNCNSTNAMAKISQGEDRQNVSFEEVPELVWQAVVDSEDADFFEHKGVNPIAISRALYWDLRSGTTVQGGSTITQQFVKNTFLSHEQTVTRKVKEAMLAIKVEQSYSKEEILEGYLNTIFFGRNVYGIKAAAQAYYGKNLDQLELKEVTYLAGLIRAPNRADATVNEEAAKDRRTKVLVAMLEEGHITQADYDATVDLPFDYVTAPVTGGNKTIKMQGAGGGYITQYVSQSILNDPETYNLTEEELALGGLRVYTTINPAMQQAAWDAMYNPAVNTSYPLNNPDLPLGAMVSIDDKGHVKAMVGGRGDGSGANFAVAGHGASGRPVGSTFKPIVLAEAIRQGYSLESMLPAPQQAEIPSIPECGDWQPRNAGESEIPGERIDLMTATQESVNTAYANLIYELAVGNGGSTAKVTEMAAALGMDPEQINKCLTMVLGSNNSTPLEMAEVYSTFANGGVHRPPKVILKIERVDQEGKVTLIYQAAEESSRALNEIEAARVTASLERVIADGTGWRAKLNIPAAGKTGTTGDNKDAWFVGYTPKLTTAVWMGFEIPDQDNPECKADAAAGVTEGQWADFAGQPEKCPAKIASMGTAGEQSKPVYEWDMVTGGSIPAIIWKLYMDKATAGTNDPFRQLTPEELRAGKDFETGEYVTDTTTTTTLPTGPTGPVVTEPTMTLPSFPQIPTTSIPPTDPPVPDTTTTTDPRGGGPPGGGGGGD